jgi:hypothetical protein
VPESGWINAEWDPAFGPAGKYKGSPGMYPGEMSKKAIDLLYHDKDWEGRKTNNFYNNLMVVIDSERTQGVTSDMWIARIFGYDSDVIPEGSKYNFTQSEIKRVAETLGWRPHQVQASIWVYAKTLWESMEKEVDAAAIKNGIKQLKLKNPEYDQLYRKMFSEKMKQDLMLTEGGVQPAENAIFNFGHAMQGKPLFVSWEAIPGANTNILPKLLEADYQTKLEFTKDMIEAFTDPITGRDIIGEEMGWHPNGKPSDPGVSSYVNSKGQVEYNPAVKTPFYSPVAAGGESELTLEITGFDEAKNYARVLARYAHQEAVGGFRPFFESKVSESNGLFIDIGRAFYESELEKIIPKLPNGIVFYTDLKGGHFVNAYAEMTNKDFQKMLANVLSDSDIQIKEGQKLSGNKYHAKTLYEKRDNELTGRWAGSPDLFNRLDVRLSPRIEAVYQSWKERGFGSAPDRIQYGNGQKSLPKEEISSVEKLVIDARARIESRMKEGRVLSGLDPSEIVDYAIVGADYLGRGVRDFTKWSAEMVKEFGESVKPMLRDIYSKAQVEQKNAIRLQAYKTRTEKQTADLLERARTGNLAPKPKPGPFKFDEEALRLQAENIEAKREFEKALLVKKLEDRTSLEYARDQFLKYRRGFLLSNPVTLAKLSAAAAARIAITPVEEAVGGILGKIPGISAVAKKAAREGDFNIQAEAKAVASLFEKGLPDAWETMSKGKGPIDSVFGRKGIHESEINPSAVEFFGHLHAALKAPVKRAEFVRATEKISQFYAKQGMDIKDPMMMERIGMEAYKSAERSIFMNDNKLASSFNNLIRSLESPSKETGKPTAAGKSFSTVLQTLFPIVKVPTSIVLETAEYAGGSIKGLYDLRKAYEKGIDNLTSDQADVIMRQLKKGSIGGALLVFGFFNPQIFGGYYELGEKRKPDEPKAKSMKVDGQDVPAYLLHAPVHEIPQIGATARRAMESHLKKGESGEIAVASGAWAAAIGLIEEIPFTRGAMEVSRLVDPNRREAAAGNILKSIIVPQLFQYAAEKMDVDVYGEPIKRKPKTMMQAIESGIPGLREDVPVKRDINTSYRK